MSTNERDSWQATNRDQLDHCTMLPPKRGAAIQLFDSVFFMRGVDRVDALMTITPRGNVKPG
jgi:hypothetical protein